MPSEPCVCGCVSLWGHWQHLPDCPWLKAQKPNLRDELAKVLEANYSRSLDDDTDRAAVLGSLMNLFTIR